MLIDRTKAAVAALVLALPALLGSSSSRAAAGPDGAIAPIIACDKLAKTDLGRVDAQVASARVLNRNGHDFCDVTGYMTPVTRFEILLPQVTWHGDYLQQGCGGFCGHVDVDLQDPSRTSGYQAPYAPVANGEWVVAADDQGHETPTNSETLWGKTDLQLRLEFGYLSEHRLALVAKSLILAFYGRHPAYSYFSGVSDGGHEALVLAQRFPDDFDGIIAGAPGNNWATLAGVFEPWVASANRGPDGRQILTAEKLPALHAAVMAACADAHGTIVDPRSCTFDPGSLRCAGGVDTNTCLTDPEIAVVRDEYRGPHDPNGRTLFDGGEPYGSELAWANWIVMPRADLDAPGDSYASLGLNYLNNLAFWSPPATAFQLGSIPFTVAMRNRVQAEGRIYNADNPDISGFKARGGKLILYHSWADQAIPPFASLNYYRAMAKQMGGYAAAQDFTRLYMVPGLYHCPCGQPVDGDPATTVQFMPQLVDWVEHGTAPAAITLPVTAQTTGDHLDSLTISPFDPFQPEPKNNGLNSNYDAVGAVSDYRTENEVWCDWKDQRLVCTPHS